MEKKVVLIGSACRETGLCPDTIRGLELKGIVLPQRDDSGRRLYCQEDIKRIKRYLIEKEASATRSLRRGNHG